MLTALNNTEKTCGCQRAFRKITEVAAKRALGNDRDVPHQDAVDGLRFERTEKAVAFRIWMR